MIRYHGGPITPLDAAIACWKGAHAMISFAYPDQLPIAAEMAHSFALDNGAFSAWKKGEKADWDGYAKWVLEWRNHPGFDFALIPDVIDGSEADNDSLIRHFCWDNLYGSRFLCPVWHMHESTERLHELVEVWPRVAIGNSGEFARIGTRRWWSRMSQAMEVACDSEGHPRTRLHGLRQMDPTIFSHIPYASVDSTMVARNIGIDSAWRGTFLPPTKEARALILRERIEVHASASRWKGSTGIQSNLELLG